MPVSLPYRPHPWHGLSPGDRFPEIVTAYVEIVPSDGVKNEIDKHSGYLKVDRPQPLSSTCPTLYGFVPRTYCAECVAGLAVDGAAPVTKGDGDPLDICIFTDRPLMRGDILLEARPIGGLRMVERGEADDKILAVLIGAALVFFVFPKPVMNAPSAIPLFRDLADFMSKNVTCSIQLVFDGLDRLFQDPLPFQCLQAFIENLPPKVIL